MIIRRTIKNFELFKISRRTKPYLFKSSIINRNWRRCIQKIISWISYFNSEVLQNMLSLEEFYSSILQHHFVMDYVWFCNVSQFLHSCKLIGLFPLPFHCQFSSAWSFLLSVFSMITFYYLNFLKTSFLFCNHQWKPTFIFNHHVIQIEKGPKI